MPLEMTTIADKLNASGYRSHQIGKVRRHIAPPTRPAARLTPPYPSSPMLKRLLKGEGGAAE